MMDIHPNNEQVVSIGNLLTAFFLNMPLRKIWCRAVLSTKNLKQSPASILNFY